VTASTIFLHTNAAAKPDRRCATRVSSYVYGNVQNGTAELIAVWAKIGATTGKA
jgi:hypothetical protein